MYSTLIPESPTQAAAAAATSAALCRLHRAGTCTREREPAFCANNSCHHVLIEQQLCVFPAIWSSTGRQGEDGTGAPRALSAGPSARYEQRRTGQGRAAYAPPWSDGSASVAMDALKEMAAGHCKSLRRTVADMMDGTIPMQHLARQIAGRLSPEEKAVVAAIFGARRR